MAWLAVTLLGGFEARVSGSPPAALPARAQALLARLSLPLGQTHPRDKLAALLWPDAPSARARQSLRQMLLTIRQAFPAGVPPLLIESGDGVALDVAAVTVDADALDRLASDGSAEAIEQAAALCRGELLDGLAPQDGPFEEWLLTQRERLREITLQVLSALLRRQIDGDPSAAIRTAGRLLALEPADEAVHRTLMRLYAAQGRRTAALRQYELCRAALTRELGLEPEALTRQLYREILQSPTREPEAALPRAADAEWSPVRVPDARLVGRRVELERLTRCRERAWSGAGRVVAILGEAGIGKTRIVESAMEDARAYGGLVLVGRSYESTQALPFGPWIDALRSGGVIDRLAREPALGEPFRTELARVLPQLGSRGAPAGGGEDRLRLFEAMAHVVELTARREPLLLVVEDAHWADEASLQLFAFIAHRLAAWPVLLIATAREEEIAPALRQVLSEIDREPHTERVTLGPLSREDTIALTRHLARARRAPAAVDALGDRIWDASAGNPFVAVETVRAFEEVDAPATDRPLPLPSRVRETIDARLDRLGDPARDFAAVAAVIGRQFSFALARNAAGHDAEAAARAVEELVARRILHVVDDRLDFTHDRIREVVHARLLPPRRQLLHAAVARAIETVYPDRLDELSDRLAHHYAKTDLDAPAIAYLTRFAERAAQAYASAAAADALHEALVRARRATDDDADDRVLALLDKYTLSLAVLGRFQDILDLLLPERARADRARDARLASAYFFRLGLTYSYLGEPREAAVWAERALAEAERAGDDTGAGRARYVLALAAYYLGALSAGIDHARRGIAHLERGPARLDMSWLGQTQWVLGLLLALRGEFEAALDAEAAVEATAARLGGEPRLESFAAWTRGWIHAMRGEAAAGVELCRFSLAAAPDPVNKTLSAGRLAIAHLEHGDASAALPLLEESVDRLAKFRFPQIQGLYTALLAEARLSTGDAAGAREAATRAVELTRDDRYPYGLGWARRALAHIARAAGDLDTAAIETRVAIETFVAVEARFEAARTQVLLADVTSERREATAALEEAARALASMSVGRYDARIAALRARGSATRDSRRR